MHLLFGITILLYVVVLVILLCKYVRTRDAGFLWLGVAVVIWPTAVALLRSPERNLLSRLVTGQQVNWYPASLVEQGRMTIGTFVSGLRLTEELIGAIILLVAVSCLGRSQVVSSTSMP